ncbi:beta-ketoacyl synthase N-terminal-like domain-containing protein, partial [Nostoc sp. UHCC 0252]|uniref:beta-ketoacyl synthase N-terminal-like domain-containing protein n=1 Tax=Nostoc sp. UHCC 0252 TaxID=3110241 RepID=UPI002B20005D
MLEKNHNSYTFPMIAIVGMSSLLPEAKTVGEFWENILSRKDCIKEIVDADPKEFDGYWRLDEYYDSNPLAVDKTYGKTGGFIPEIQFDPIEFGIPPIHLESISTTQLFALVVAKQALADAGYSRISPTNKLKGDRTGVILGVGGCGNIAFTLATRTNIPQWEKVMGNIGLPEEVVQVTLEKLQSLYAGWRESSFPGLLGNVVTGRISSYFDLGGTNCTLDAACASSLAAIKMAIAELADGSCDAVLTGGVNVDNSILAYMCFSKTPALSKQGLSRPFDANSDGIVLGDGIGMLVLKRLEDAQADGNKIYGVIRGIGSSSDGRAKSIYAPRFEGQIKALNRAYQKAGIDPQEIQLVEAHGTGTVAGDLCEIKSISAVYQEHQVPGASVALGSVKSQIGHTRIAAGAASLIKVALGLYHKILPPTINVTQPHPQLDLDRSCFYINTEARPWIQPVDGSKRRAAVSSFGFGGTNFHVIVEEYQTEHESAYRIHQLPEVFIVQAANAEVLRQTCQELLAKFKSAEGDNHYHQYCNSQRNTRIPENSARLGFVSESLEQTIDYLEQALTLLSKQSSEAWQHPKGIYYRCRGLDPDSKIVALFPGQGSQYLNMGSDWAKNYPELRQVLAQLDENFAAENHSPLSQIIYPPSVFNSEKLEQQKNELLKTENAQPAIGAVSAGIYQVLKKAGFKPDFVVGHSFGELTALWASGSLSDRAFYELSIARGQAMRVNPDSPTKVGLMLAVNANETRLQKFLTQFSDVTITNYNSNAQTVLGGSQSSITTLQQQLNSEGIKTTLLSVANAFHTKFVEHAAQPFAEKILQTNFAQPLIPVYSNVTAQPYPEDTEKIQQILAHHLLSPVAFKQTIDNIYAKGGRVFVEIGPKNVLTSFVSDILKDKEHIAIALNPSSPKSPEYEFRRAIVQLLVAGLDLNGFDPYALPKPVAEVKSKPGLAITLNGGFYLNPDTKELRQKALVEKDTTVWDNFLHSYLSVPQPSSDLGTANSLATELSAITSAIEANGSYPASNAEETRVTSSVDFNLEPEFHRSEVTQIEEFSQQQMITPEEIIMQKALSNSVNTLTFPETPSLQIANYQISDQITSQNLISTIHQQFHQNQAQYLDLLSKIIDRQSLLLEQYKESEVLPQVMQNLEKVLELLQTNLGYINANHQYYLQSQLSLLQSNGQPKADLTPPLIPQDQQGKNQPSLQMSVAVTNEVLTAPTIYLPTDEVVANNLPSPPQATVSEITASLQPLVISSDSINITEEKPTETTPATSQPAASLQLLVIDSDSVVSKEKPLNTVSDGKVAVVSSPKVETTNFISNVDIEAISTS